LSWLNWNLTRSQLALLDFVKLLIEIKKTHPVFQRRRFFQGRRIEDSEVKDIAWFGSHGKEMSHEDWQMGLRTLGIRLAGDAIVEKDSQGRPIVDETFLVLLNAHHEEVAFILPAHTKSVRWELVFDTSISLDDKSLKHMKMLKGGHPYQLISRGFALFRSQRL
jgi:glycogen operon protein